MDLEKFLLLISDFIDNELDFEIEREFVENFEDECCLYYFNTFRKTVELCRDVQLAEIPQGLHRKLIAKIECEPAALPYDEKPRPARARRRTKAANRKKTTKHAGAARKK